MANFLQVFVFEANQIRSIIDEAGNPWFVAKDIAKLLGYANAPKAARDHCKHLKILKTNESELLNIPTRGLQIIPEGDVYRLIIRSKLPAAEKFEDWLMEELLPTLRKTGQYQMTDQQYVDFPLVENPYTKTYLSVDGQEDAMCKEVRNILVATLNELGFRHSCYKQQITNNVSRILIGVPIKPFRRAFGIPPRSKFRTRLLFDYRLRRAWNQIENTARAALLFKRPKKFSDVEAIVYDAARTVKHWCELQGVDLTCHMPDQLEHDQSV